MSIADPCGNRGMDLASGGPYSGHQQPAAWIWRSNEHPSQWYCVFLGRQCAAVLVLRPATFAPPPTHDVVVGRYAIHAPRILPPQRHVPALPPLQLHATGNSCRHGFADAGSRAQYPERGLSALCGGVLRGQFRDLASAWRDGCAALGILQENSTGSTQDGCNYVSLQ